MPATEDPRLRSYKALRKTVGYLGIGLPLILAIGAFTISRTDLQQSISHYIDTIMSGAFVGILFVIGFFLLFYRGYDKRDDEGRFWPSDNLAGNIACFCALGVALFPTTSTTAWIRYVHVGAAIGMFATLAYFSYFLFTKTAQGETAEGRKRTRNWWYRAFAIIIVISIVLIPVVNSVPRESGLHDIQPAFWLESIALWAFGFAWAMKGQARWLLPDTE